MTEEEKRLLLQDLVARLPYTPMVNLRGKAGYDRKLVSVHRYNTRSEFEIVVNSDDDEDYMPHNFEIDIVKPYLRPMSSMTKEEVEELNDVNGWRKLGCRRCCYNRSENYFFSGNNGTNNQLYIDDLNNCYDWLNAHHFDWRGLIEKGLALKAPDGMYNGQNN